MDQPEGTGSLPEFDHPDLVPGGGGSFLVDVETNGHPLGWTLGRFAGVVSDRTERHYAFAGVIFSLQGPRFDLGFGLLHDNFSAMCTPQKLDAQNPMFVISVEIRSGGYSIFLDGLPEAQYVERDKLLFTVEGVIVVQAQIVCSDLVFLHAAVLEYQGTGCLFVGESGAGKSTLCWALSQQGFTYASDELAPLFRLNGAWLAHTYPHALCLKEPIPASHSLPLGSFHTGMTWHVPAHLTQGGVQAEAIKIDNVFFVQYSGGNEPSIRPLSAAECAHQLYPQFLNALAHSNKGLSAVADISQDVSSVRLVSGDLDDTCRLVKSLMQRS